MPYASGRVIHDADAHIMELPGFLEDHLEARYRARVSDEVLFPRDTWPDKDAYDETARRIAAMFHENFAKYADGVSEEIRNAGPVPVDTDVNAEG